MTGGNPETLTNAAGVVVFEGTTSESGGSQPGWQGPFPFAAADWNTDLGGGNAGIALVGPSFPVASLLLRALIVVDVSFDHDTNGIAVAVGDPSIDYGTSTRVTGDSGPYDTFNGLLQEAALAWFGSITYQETSIPAGGLPILQSGLVAWISDIFDDVPTVGSGRVWFEVPSVQAPA